MPQTSQVRLVADAASSNNNNNNNKPNSPAHTDSQAYIAKAQWHDAQATARNNTAYIMLIRHSAQQAQVEITASRKTGGG